MNEIKKIIQKLKTIEKSEKREEIKKVINEAIATIEYLDDQLDTAEYTCFPHFMRRETLIKLMEKEVI